MRNKVAPKSAQNGEDFDDIGDFDSIIEAEMEACSRQVAAFLALKDEAPAIYNKALEDLKAISHGKSVKGRFEGMTPELADAILMDLGVETADTARAEIEEILARDSAVEFMGDPEHFISIDDAIASGELKEDTL